MMLLDSFGDGLVDEDELLLLYDINTSKNPMFPYEKYEEFKLGAGGEGGIFIYSCSARLISFQMNLKTTDFKRNSSGRTRIYEYNTPN